MQHLLVHYQNVGSHRIIRIIPIMNLDAYKAEFSSVYKTKDGDDVMHIFFNVSDMSGRLVSDIGFKSFKGCGKLEKITENLFKIPEKAPADFFTAMFLPWAKDKIADYVADLDETSAINTEDLKSSPLTPSEVAQFVHVQFDEGVTFYNLLNCHKTDDDGCFVLSEHHLKALFMAYAKNNKTQFGPHRMEGGTITCRQDADGQFVPYQPGEEQEEIVYECIETLQTTWPESHFKYADTDDKKSLIDRIRENSKRVYVLSSIRFGKQNHGGLPIKIGEVAYGKGITVNKTALTNHDIDVLMEQLGITEALNKALSYLILKNDVTEFDEIEGYDELHKMYKKYVSFDGSWISMDGDGYSYCPYELVVDTETPLKVWEIWDPRAVKSSRNPKKITDVVRVPSVPSVPSVSNVEKSHIFYKDVITNAVRCFKNELEYLPEFQRLGDMNCKNHMVNKIMENFVSNGTFDIDCEVVQELTILTSLMSSFFSDEKLSNNEKNEQVCDRQYELTKEYVNRYKSDKEEMSAAIAVENVYTYLLLGRVQDINKNRIGSDLVDLGVKKTRKTKGYVYGMKALSNFYDMTVSYSGKAKELDKYMNPAPTSS